VATGWKALLLRCVEGDGDAKKKGGGSEGNRSTIVTVFFGMITLEFSDQLLRCMTSRMVGGWGFSRGRLSPVVLFLRFSPLSFALSHPYKESFLPSLVSFSPALGSRKRK